MIRKLCVVIALAGSFVVYQFLWGNPIYSASAVAADGPVDAGADGSIPLVLEEADAVDVDGEEIPADAHNPFASHPHYDPDALERYEEYQRTMPNLDADTVLWHVNAGLDHEFYPLTADTGSHNPLLVNKQNKLPDGYEPEELVEIHSNIMATPGTAEAFRRMRAAAAQDGIYIEAAAGYRSHERQRELFEAEELSAGTEAAEQRVARPGYEEHSTGRALHIVDRNYTFTGFEQRPEYHWLMENCAEYGFILRYGEDTSHVTGFDYEPYHFTFVGRDIALAMRDSGMDTLEEYIARGLAPPDSRPIDDRMAVVIVPGSGGGSDEAMETDIALDIKGRLEQENVRVVVTRDSRDLESETRAAALIVIDQADSADPTVAWFDSGTPQSRSLAETVGSRLEWAGLGSDVRPLPAGNRGDIMSLAQAPAVFIEISGPCGTARSDDREKLAKSISDALIAHLGIRQMYLTFDDGPSPKNTPRVLEILREKGVKATFFVIGEMAEANPELLKQIVEEGHAIGIHCYKHDYNQLYSSVQSFLDDFYRARNAVEEITGLAPVIYRFPGGSINHYNKGVYRQIIDEMDRLGFVYFDWNISVDDAMNGVKTGDLMRTVSESTRHRHAVLLMHDAYPHIGKELEEIIHFYSDYQMNVITQDTEPVHLR